MRAISLYQPWAGWVAMGWKTIETRTHDRFKGLKGQRIAIHAAKKFDKDVEEKVFNYIIGRDVKDFPGWNEYGKVRGAVICTAFVQDFRKLTESDSRNALCDCGGGNLYGLILKDVERLIVPIPWKGLQGIFNVPDEIINGNLSECGST